MDSQNISYKKIQTLKAVFLNAAFVLSIAFILLSFSGTSLILKDYWITDSSYSHGPLILCISIYLIFWQHKNKLLNAKIQPTAFYLPFLFAFIFFWWSSKALNIQVLQVAALPIILLTTFYCLWGKVIGRIFYFPILLLYLAIPVWTIALKPLQDMTIMVNAFLIDITRIPAFIKGTNVHIPAGVFSIEEGCAGLKYLLSALSTILLMGHLSCASIKTKYFAALLAIFAALIANWVRVFLIIMIGHNSHMTSDIVNDHNNFGWLIFTVFFIPLLLVCHKLLPINTQGPVNDIPHKHGNNGLTKVAYQSVIALTIIVFVVISSRVLSPSNITTLHIAAHKDLPAGTGHWRGPFTLNTPDNLPHFKGFSHMLSGIYKSVDTSVTVSIIQYQKQKQGSELIHYDNHIFDSNQWQPAKQRIYRPVFGINKRQAMMELELISNTKRKRLIYYWYQIGPYSTTSKIYAKLLQIPTLLHRRSDAGLFFLSIDCRDNCDYAKDKIQPLLKNIMRST